MKVPSILKQQKEVLSCVIRVVYFITHNYWCVCVPCVTCMVVGVREWLRG